MLYIFDMGGVVLRNVFELKDILEAEGADLDMFSLYRDDLMDRYSAGKITEEAYWEGFNKLYGTQIRAPRWGRFFNPEVDTEMVAFIEELKRNNRVVCGSNTIDPHWKWSMNRGDYNCFHKVYASHLMGVAKPDTRFWEMILESEEAKAEEAVFIDDFPDNVEAAASMGIRAVLYRDLSSLREELALPV